MKIVAISDLHGTLLPIKDYFERCELICICGDISQNGRRRQEYLGYFDGLQGINRKYPIMACMGNNDLRDKKYGQCFANFFTNENQWANSVYRYRIGDVEFIGLNSNTDLDYVKGGDLGNYDNYNAFCDMRFNFSS